MQLDATSKTTKLGQAQGNHEVIGSLEKRVLEATDTAWHEYVRSFVVRHDRVTGERPRERLVSKLMAEPLFSLPSPCRRRHRKERAALTVQEVSSESKSLSATSAPRRRYLLSPPRYGRHRWPDSVESSHTSSTGSSVDGSDHQSRHRLFGVSALETDNEDALDAFVYAWHAKKILGMFKPCHAQESRVER